LLDSRQVADAAGSFDIITAIEVIEHVAEPIPWLAAIRQLLRPGGLFFYTTGNTSRYRRHDAFVQWSYVVPDLHVSYFDPRNAAMALQAAGFKVRRLGWRPGCAQIIRSRALKNLRVRRPTFWERLLPWKLLAPFLNAQFGVFDFPIGQA
jgi:SAM-dependent methyltransferase